MRHWTVLLLGVVLTVQSCALPSDATEDPDTMSTDVLVDQPGSADGAPLHVSVLRSASPTQIHSAAGHAPAAGSYVVHLIDVGTGLSVLLQGHDFNVLFDGGSIDDQRGITATGNKNRLLSYLAATIGLSGPARCTPEGDGYAKADRPFRTIDHLFLSHNHDDHVSMLADVLACYHVTNVWEPGAVAHSLTYANFVSGVANQKGTTYHTAATPNPSHVVDTGLRSVPLGPMVTWVEYDDGETGTFGLGARFKVLHADGVVRTDENLNSIVLRVDLGTTSLLLAGDAEAGARAAPTASVGQVEGFLLASHRSDLDVDIFQVGHHGSTTSSRLEFLRAVTPRIALIGCGPRAYAGAVLPEAPVVDALHQILGPNGTLLRTDDRDASACMGVTNRIGVEDGYGGCDNWVIRVPPGASFAPTGG